MGIGGGFACMKREGGVENLPGKDPERNAKSQEVTASEGEQRTLSATLRLCSFADACHSFQRISGNHMSSRQHIEQILTLAEKESAIIIHLAEKIDDPAHLDHRPTPGQRSLLETLQAISSMIQISVEFSLTGEFNQARREQAVQVTLDTFPEAMRAQMVEIHTLLAEVTDQDLLDRVSLHPATRDQPLGLGLMRALVSFLAAYKMQIFLYLKSLGRAELNTANAWMGVDRRPTPQPASN